MAYKDKYPSVLLEDAVEAISSLPGVGKKGALRLALHLLKQPQENVHHFASAVNRLRDEVKYCRECSMISDGDVCSICSDRSRDHRTICVVESVRESLNENIYDTMIHRNVRLAEAPSYGMPITVYDTRSVGAEDYRMLAAEVIKRGEGL